MENRKSVTAVEWLVEELEDNGINLDLASEIIEQAKEIEKQQCYSKEDLISFYNFIKEKCDIVNTSGYAETHVKWFIEKFKKK